MSALGDGVRDLVKVELHGLGVGVGQRQRRARAARRGTAAPRKLMLLLLGVRTRGRWSVSANRVFGLIRSIHRRGPTLSENGRLVSGLRSRAYAHSNAAFSALAYGVSQAHRTTSTCRTCAAVAVRSVWMRYDELAFREPRTVNVREVLNAIFYCFGRAVSGRRFRRTCRRAARSGSTWTCGIGTARWDAPECRLPHSCTPAA